VGDNRSAKHQAATPGSMANLVQPSRGGPVTFLVVQPRAYPARPCWVGLGHLFSLPIRSLCYNPHMQTTVNYTSYAKQASSESRQEVQNIMETIRQENPEYWPYGLSIGHHDGGVYMIREASTQSPVGFVGWQERLRPPMKKVGFYSIGVLPEHRGHGYAKEAIQKIIREKASGVDEVRAMIVHTNKASKNLAEALGIPVDQVS